MPVAQSVAPFDPDSAPWGAERAACVGDKDINGVSTTTWDMPLHASYRTARTTSIYIASEFGCDGGTLTGLRYYVQSLPGQILTTFTIRLRQTTATAYATAAFDNTGWTVVYQADTTLNATGWNTFTFPTPFAYAAPNNLEVDVTFSNAAPTSNGTVYYFTATGNRSLFKFCAACSCGGSTNPLEWTSCAGVTQTTKVPRVQFIFEPPAVTACCVNYECVPVNTQQECNDLNGTWYGGQECATFFCPPPNDDCTAVTPVTLTAGTAETFTGNNLGATYDPNDCPSFPGGQVWHAFTLPSQTASNWDVTLDHCGTTPPFGNQWLSCAIGCPCSGITPAGTVEWTTCLDQNATIRWPGLPADTYYYPVLLDPNNAAAGPYTLHVVATPSYCGAAAITCNEYISRVTLSEIDNSSACIPGGYADYTGLSTYIIAGNSYQLTVSNGVGYSADQCGVWVDWNHDLDFSDAGEQLTVFGTPGPGAYTATVTPPPGAALGTTRLRIRVMNTGVLSPCGTVDLGEVEDYTIDVESVLPTGACCLADGTCQVLSRQDCVVASGTYQGDGSTCTPDLCPQPTRACCQADGSCAITTQALCTGIWHADWTSCDPNPCPPPTGACCQADACTITTQVQCTGTWHADSTSCDPNPCLQPTAACCQADGSCAITTQALCTGIWHAEWTSCDPNPCPQPTGACCTGSNCQILTALGCAAALGDYQGNDSVCTPNPCQAPSGVCPGDFNCDGQRDFADINPFVLYLSNFSNWRITYPCDARNGDINGDGTYGQGSFGDINPFVQLLSSAPLPIPCPQSAQGACCSAGSVCQMRTATECSAASGVYQGDNRPCEPNPCICVGDLNCDGLVDFGDINPFVLYLSNPSGWQATYPACPMLNGDINGDGTYGGSSFGDINPFVVLLSTPPLPHACPY